MSVASDSRRTQRMLQFCRHLARRLAILPIRGYQLFISPVLPPSCRFTPTCSAYAIEALMTHGLLKGGGLTVWRLLRCNPWSAGGYDPVPPRRTKTGHPHKATSGIEVGSNDDDATRNAGLQHRVSNRDNALVSSSRAGGQILSGQSEVSALLSMSNPAFSSCTHSRGFCAAGQDPQPTQESLEHHGRQ